MQNEYESGGEVFLINRKPHRKEWRIVEKIQPKPEPERVKAETNLWNKTVEVWWNPLSIKFITNTQVTTSLFQRE